MEREEGRGEEGGERGERLGRRARRRAAPRGVVKSSVVIRVFKQIILYLRSLRVKYPTSL